MTGSLKELIASDQLSFLCEAHNGISAKIVEEAGFPGIWASGLTMSSSLAVRDSNEASWTQVLDLLEFMSDAVEIPILLDGDTGYGNFNNMRRLVSKLCTRGIAGVCIEDKLFPKTNSFINSEAQPLADMDEFCGKIKAGKDAQSHDDFCVVARTEAFVVGLGLKEALKRAEAYRDAGADAILVQSKQAHAGEIEAFMKAWDQRHPVIIIPTKYYTAPADLFRDLGVRVVIWANQLMRSSIVSMQQTAAEIFREQSVASIEDNIAPLNEVFRLQGAKELQEAEEQYLPQRAKGCTSIILAASRGQELRDLTLDKPKAMIQIHGQPILEALVETFRKMGIRKNVVVRGYKKEAIDGEGLIKFDNDRFEETEELASLYLAREYLQGHALLAYGDCIYRSHLVRDLLESPHCFTIMVDADARDNRRLKDLVTCSIPFMNAFMRQDVELRKVYEGVDASDAMGEWTGLLSMNAEGSDIAAGILDRQHRQDDFNQLKCTDLLREIMKEKPVHVVYTRGGWLDVDDMDVVVKAGGVS